MLAAIHMVSVALATFGVIILAGWVIEQILKDVRRDRRKRKSGR
jgi:hypothetical protein